MEEVLRITSGNGRTVWSHSGDRAKGFPLHREGASLGWEWNPICDDLILIPGAGLLCFTPGKREFCAVSFLGQGKGHHLCNDSLLLLMSRVLPPTIIHSNNEYIGKPFYLCINYLVHTIYN